MMESNSPVPSWQYRVEQFVDVDTISATGNRHQLLGNMWTLESIGQDIRSRRHPLANAQGDKGPKPLRGPRPSAGDEHS